MAVINYATCGINDVIAYSLDLHPKLLADCLRFHARVHAQFADAYNDSEVMRNELDLADRLHSFADVIALGEHTVPGAFDVRREAFSCAAWLQDLHTIMRDLIVEQEQGDASLDRSG